MAHIGGHGGGGTHRPVGVIRGGLGREALSGQLRLAAAQGHHPQGSHGLLAARVSVLRPHEQDGSCRGLHAPLQSLAHPATLDGSQRDRRDPSLGAE